MKKINKIKCFLGFHLWDERSEGVKCLRGGCINSYHLISWDDPKIRDIKYKRNSLREYLGR